MRIERRNARDRTTTLRGFSASGLFWVALALSLVGCPEDDPTATGFDAAADPTDVDFDTTDGTTDPTTDDTTSDAALNPVVLDPSTAWIPSACQPDPDAYAPGVDDAWPVCVADTGSYVTIEENVSTIARVGAFEDIADLLWRGDPPTSDDFLSARDLYATGEGLDSRVQRREDEHYGPVVQGEETLSCRDEGVPPLDPDRCVGPAQILPVLNDAFQRGIRGDAPRVQAARIEAALLWFLYVSTYKEGTTCAAVRKDCDSAWAYYTGGSQRGEGIGLSGYVREVVPSADDTAFDGILGLRCWRDVEQGEPAVDTTLQALALAQVDGALLYGIARIVANRVGVMARGESASADADWAFVQLLGAVLDREATVRDATAAEVLRAAWATADGTAVDAAVVIETLADVFPCP